MRIDDVIQAIERADRLARCGPFRRFAEEEIVGHYERQDARDALDDAMLEVALERAEGNQAAAARLLGVSRQWVQHSLQAGRRG